MQVSIVFKHTDCTSARIRTCGQSRRLDKQSCLTFRHIWSAGFQRTSLKCGYVRVTSGLPPPMENSGGFNRSACARSLSFKRRQEIRELSALECMLTVDWSLQRKPLYKNSWDTHVVSTWFFKKGTGTTIEFHMASTRNDINKDNCKFAGYTCIEINLISS